MQEEMDKKDQLIISQQLADDLKEQTIERLNREIAAAQEEIGTMNFAAHEQAKVIKELHEQNEKHI